MRKQDKNRSVKSPRKGLGARLGAWFSAPGNTSVAENDSLTEAFGDAPSKDALIGAPVIDGVEAVVEAPVGEGDSLDELISQFRLAMTALKTLGGESDDEGEDSVSLPLHFVLGLLPEHYIVSRELDTVPLREPIIVGIQDLISQLAGGQIITNVATLVRSLPSKLITSEGFADSATAIVVPLPQVVAGLAPGALRKHTPAEDTQYAIDDLPNLFVELTEDQRRAEKEAQAPANTPQASTTADATQGETATADSPAADKGVEQVVFDVKLTHADSGVDLNSATAEQIVSIDGVSVEIANRIVSHRRENGPFENVFDLTQVQSINRKAFHVITGMPFNRQRLDRSNVLARMLNIPEGSVSHLPTVARVIGQHNDLNGCMVSDGGGLLLAQYGISADSDALAAVVPRMFKQIQDNMHKIVVTDIRAASICVEGKMFTIVTGGNIYITVIQLSSKLTKDVHKFIAKVAHELEWVLSHRGYVKPKRKQEPEPAALEPVESKV